MSKIGFWGCSLVSPTLCGNSGILLSYGRALINIAIPSDETHLHIFSTSQIVGFCFCLSACSTLFTFTKWCSLMWVRSRIWNGRLLTHVLGFSSEESAKIEFRKELLSTNTKGRERGPESELKMVKKEVQDQGNGQDWMTENVGETSIGLKLGKRIYFEDRGGRGNRDSTFLQNLTNTSKKNSSNKKQNASSSSTTPSANIPRCRAEGCKASLSNAKDYYRRHKICEWHSKAVMVKVGNLEQRFCQQCSRFHVLDEFDEGKRSCRRRLAGHNLRRRKKQPEAIHSLHSASFSYLQDDKHVLSNPGLLHQHHQRSTNFMASSLDHTSLQTCHTQILKLLGIPTPSSLQLQHFMESSAGLLTDSHGLAFSKPTGAFGLISSQASPLPSHPPSGRALSLLSSSLGFPNDCCTMSLGVSHHPSPSMEQLFAQNQATSYPQILTRSISQPCFTPISNKLLGMVTSSQSLCSSNEGLTALPTTMKVEKHELPLTSTLDDNFISQQNEFQSLFAGDTQCGRNSLGLVQITAPQFPASRPAALETLGRVQHTHKSMFGN